MIDAEREEVTDWPTWIRDLGRHVRRVRELLGLSQEQVARSAGVSQGAVSRLEAGRGLATPLLVVMKITSAMRRAVATVDPELLSEDAHRRAAAAAAVPFRPADVEPFPVLKEESLEELIRLYRELPERHRGKLLAVVRATVAALSGSDDVDDDSTQRGVRSVG
jgi:transcriptional regulator with XRE-family HTH domain